MGAESALIPRPGPAKALVLPRRRALVELGALTATLVLSACRRATDRETVLFELVSEVVARDTERVVAEARSLERSVRGFAEHPDAATQASAREALKHTLVAWKRASAFRAGPIAESNVFLRAMFWPVRPPLIDAVLDGERPVDEGLVEQLGAHQKGLYALEYLLFERAGAGGRAVSEQERRFAREVSANVLGYAERGARRWGDGRAYAKEFAASGQDGVAKLAEVTTDSVEIVFGKLDRVERRNARGAAGPAEVEGYFSQTSLEVALALLAGAEALFTGSGAGGLGALVAAISPSVTTRVKSEFAAARAALSALRAPLERSVRDDPARFSAAAAAVRKLERTLKLEVASALGLSLVFGSGDGD